MARADFTPEEVLIVANSNVAVSKEIAKHYADLRKIPQDNIIELKTKNSFSLSRQEYESEIRDPLRQALLTSHLGNKIKIIVLTYGIPLKIEELPTISEPQIIYSAILKEANALSLEIKNHLEEIGKLEKIIGHEPHFFNSAVEMNLQQALVKILSLLKSIDESQKSPKTKKEQSKLLLEHAGKLFGPEAFALESKSADPKVKKNSPTSLDKTSILDNLDLNSISPDEFQSQVKKSIVINGEIITLANLKILEEKIKGSETSASVDNELPLLLFLPGSTPLSGRLPNPLFLESLRNTSQSNIPIILTSRIDGPSPEVVKRNITSAVYTEKSGRLAGKFLIDSRGMPFEDRGELATWDRKLVGLAKGDISNNFEISFDAFKELADKTDDIALYVGWYQLRNYSDNYAFKPGAVGFHIASEEALNIHNPDEKGWCKNLLERGVVTTVGAIEEPYLDSFPYPEYFFPLLSTGEYSVVEAYFLSTKYLSWRHVLFSDPLYKPFKIGINTIPKKDLEFEIPKNSLAELIKR